MRTLAISALATTLSWASMAQAVLFETQSSNLAAETRGAAKSGRHLAILFELEGCPDCARLRRSVFSAPDVEGVFACHYRTVAVDLSAPGDVTTPSGEVMARRAWADRLRIFGAPALAFFDKDGRLLYRHTGPLSNGAEFLLLGQYVAAGEADNQPFSAYRKVEASRRRAAACGEER